VAAQQLRAKGTDMEMAHNVSIPELTEAISARLVAHRLTVSLEAEIYSYNWSWIKIFWLEIMRPTLRDWHQNE
jgi:hypothetical protein